jgi:hypothetical protein
MTQESCTPPSPNGSATPNPHIVQHKNFKQSSKNQTYIWQQEPINPTKGEMALWTAVITQAVMDALSRSANKEAQFHKHEAIRWLTENSKDFIDVCLNAGMNPDDVRKKAKRVIANPPLWRAEAGTGKRYLERKKYRLKLKQQAASLRLCPHVTESAQIIEGPWG